MDVIDAADDNGNDGGGAEGKMTIKVVQQDYMCLCGTRMVPRIRACSPSLIPLGAPTRLSC